MIDLFKNIFPSKYRPSYLFSTLIHQPTIKAGPFKGMKYDANGVNSAKFPKLAGTYELELNRFFKKGFLQEFDAFIDIGAAEGYYAIGVLLIDSEIKVIAYESEVTNRIWMKHLAQINGVDKLISIRNSCNIKKLKKEVNKWKRPFILIDIEGGEYELLNHQYIDHFKHATILVELHEFVYPYMNATIRNRFNATHNIIEISEQNRTINDLPISLDRVQKRIFNKAAFEIMNEKRPILMKWLLFSPKDE